MDSNELVLAANKLMNAGAPEEIFGALTPLATEQALNDSYRKLAAMVHPDRWYAADSTLHVLARDAFARLNALKELAERKIAAGIYGKPDAKPPAPVDTFTPCYIKAGSKKYIVQSLLTQGDICDVYNVVYDKDQSGVLKIVQDRRDNDLLENETKVLKELTPKPGDPKDRYGKYLPGLVDSFTLKGGKGVRRVNALTRPKGMISLEDVKEAYPHGIDFRDAAWMLRRMLEGLGYVHHKGYVHGAVLPPHVLIHPVSHGGVLIDWSYAVKIGTTHIKAISAPYKDFYPPEVLKKMPPKPSTDIYMWARTAVYLLQDGSEFRGVDNLPLTVPKGLKDFLSSCLIAAPNRRPDNAWDLYEEFGEVLFKLVGKPTYREFRLPR